MRCSRWRIGEKLHEFSIHQTFAHLSPNVSHFALDSACTFKQFNKSPLRSCVLYASLTFIFECCSAPCVHTIANDREV